MYRLIVLALVALAVGGHAGALENGPYRISGPVLADVIDVTDGDTFQVRAYPWPNIVMEMRVRVNGLEAPERSCRGPYQAAKDAARTLLAGRRLELTNIQTDKYGGRIRADISLDGTSLPQLLLEKHPALFRLYDGGKDFCPA